MLSTEHPSKYNLRSLRYIGFVGFVSLLIAACGTSTDDAAIEVPAESSVGQSDLSSVISVDTSELHLMEAVRSIGSLDILASALTNTGLDDKLSDESLSFTLFAVDDGTFSAWGDITNSSESDARALLTYHLLDSEIGQAAGTSFVEEAVFAENGQALGFSVDEAGIWNVNGIAVDVADIQTSNGSIHILSDVLIPEENPEFLWSSFDIAEAVRHERVPETLFEDAGEDTFMRFFYGKNLNDTASNSAGAGGITGSWQGVTGGVYPYQIWLPDTFEASMPLSLILHTRGEQGDDNTSQISHAMAQTWAASMEEPTILIAPQAPNGSAAWSVEDLDSLLTTVFNNYDIDRNRLYINGHSFGGRGVLNMLLSSQYQFAAAALFAPSGQDYDLDVEQISKTPQWYVVSEADSIVDDEIVFDFFSEVIAP